MNMRNILLTIALHVLLICLLAYTVSSTAGDKEINEILNTQKSIDDNTKKAVVLDKERSRIITLINDTCNSTYNNVYNKLKTQGVKFNDTSTYVEHANAYERRFGIGSEYFIEKDLSSQNGTTNELVLIHYRNIFTSHDRVGFSPSGLEYIIVSNYKLFDTIITENGKVSPSCKCTFGAIRIPPMEYHPSVEFKSYSCASIISGQSTTDMENVLTSFVLTELKSINKRKTQ
jgi:hypothetical protein